MQFCHFFTQDYIFVNNQVNRACFTSLGADMLKILYAEDNAGMRKMVCHFLTNVGFEVIATTDGDEALEKATHEHFDVILLDVTMERMDGATAATEIRKASMNTSTPIVGLTGRTETSEIEFCKQSGMDIVLSKPVDLEALANTLHSSADDYYIDDVNEETLSEHSEKIAPKIIDVDVLQKYAQIAGTHSLEGILHDFSDLWPRKVGELYSSIVLTDTDCFARAGEELCAIAAGIGAGRVAEFAGRAVGEHSVEGRQAILPDIVHACHEVQAIINALNQSSQQNVKRVA